MVFIVFIYLSADKKQNWAIVHKTLKKCAETAHKDEVKLDLLLKENEGNRAYYCTIDMYSTSQK